MHIVCPHCLAINRVPSERLNDEPGCGQCGQPVLPGEPLNLNDAQFERFVSKTELPVVVDFWAPWCGPCQVMGPQFARAAQQLKGRAVLVKVNSDDNPSTSSRYAIRSIPTLVKLQGGREVDRISGALQAGQIVSWVAR